MSYQIVERLPTPAEYRTICESVGWGRFVNFDVAPTAIENSLYGVVATQNDAVIGMGRIVGDGAIFFYIQDIAVMPHHQKHGVGTKIMDTLIRHIHSNAPDKASIGLFSAPNATGFYEKYGFELPRKTHLTGMCYYVASK